MRLVRFLAAGKSLVGSKDLTGRYRLPHGRALPKFNSDRSTTAIQDQGPAPVESLDPVASKAEEMAAATAAAQAPESAAAHSVGDGSRPTAGGRAEQAPESAAPTPFPRLAAPAPQRRSLVRRLFGWLPGLREKPARGPIPVFSKVPVQTELSLENVKVVRNDLSESDLELKPANPANAPAVVSAPAGREPDSSAVAMRAVSADGVNNGLD